MAEASPPGERHGRVRMGRKGTAVLVAFALLVLVGLVVVFLGKPWTEEADKSAKPRPVDLLAGGIDRELEARFQSIAAAIDSAPLDAFSSLPGDQARQALLARVRAADPAILDVRVLPVGYDDVDYDSSPPLTYASVALLARAEESDRDPSPEAQLFGTEQGHIALVRRLLDDDGVLTGHVLVALSQTLIQELLDRIELESGHAEVQQRIPGAGMVVLATRGPAGEGSPEVKRLNNGNWVLSHTAAPAMGLGGDRIDVGWVSGVVGLGIVILVAALLWRRRSRRETKTAPVFGGALGNMSPKKVADMLETRNYPAPDEGVPDSEDVSNEAAPAGELTDERGEPEPEDAGSVIPEAIFRAYDIRGVVGRDLNVDLARTIGRAIGSEAAAREQQTIVVGRDGRLSSPEMAVALMEGLRASGRDVIDLGRVPTPVAYFAAHYLDVGSSVVVTGSHNPPDYNGFKVMLAGETLAEEAITAIRDRIEHEDLVSGDGGLQHMDIGADYIRRISEDIPVALGTAFKIVVDCGNGVAGELAPRLYRALGHDVIDLYCEVDGRFPNHHPDPSDPANLTVLIQTVRAEGADLGFAFDGDGDRLGVVDGEGNVIWADRLLMALGRDVLSRNPGATVVYDVKCSSRLANEITSAGGRPLMWKSGHSLMKAKMNETGAILAGELSGHIFFGERWYGFDDALYAGARLLEILQAQDESPTEFFRGLPSGLTTPELRAHLKEGEHHRFMARFPKEGVFTGAKVTILDGVRADFADGWGLIRASNTTPSLVFRFEADSEEAMTRIQEAFRDAVSKVDPALKLPF